MFLLGAVHKWRHFSVCVGGVGWLRPPPPPNFTLCHVLKVVPSTHFHLVTFTMSNIVYTNSLKTIQCDLKCWDLNWTSHSIPVTEQVTGIDICTARIPHLGFRHCDSTRYLETAKHGITDEKTGSLPLYFHGGETGQLQQPTTRFFWDKVTGAESLLHFKTFM